MYLNTIQIKIIKRISLLVLFCLIIYISLIPFQYLMEPRISILKYNFNPLKYFPIFIIFLLFIPLLFFKTLGKNVFRYQKINVLILCFFLTAFLSSFSALNFGLSLSRFVYYSLTGIVFFYFSIVYFEDFSSVRKFVRMIIIVGLIVSLYGIAEFIIKGNVFFEEVFNNSNYLYYKLMKGNMPLEAQKRIISTIGHPVTLGFFLIPPIVFSFMEYNLTKELLKKVIYIIISLILIIGMLLTFSRGSWIALFVSLCVFNYKKKKNIIGIFLPVIIIIAALVLTSGEIKEILIKRDPSTYLQDPYNKNRVMSYLTVSKILVDYPLIGIGNANFRLVRNQYDEFATNIDAPDNMLLMELAENGILGMSLFCLIIYYLLKFLKMAYQNTHDLRTKEFLWGFFCIFIGFFVNMLTFDILYQPIPRIIFWNIAGISMIMINFLNIEENINAFL